MGGQNPQVENLEIEELARDPQSPAVGRIWINTLENVLKFVTRLDEFSQPIIHTAAVVQDFVVLQGLINNHSANHAPGSADELPTGVAATLSPITGNTEGSAAAFSKSDHTHQITGFQTHSEQLDALAALQGVGVLKRLENGTLVLQALSADEIPQLDWSKIIGKPTTVSGYGITDAVDQSDLQVVQQTFEDGAASNGFVSQNDTVIDFNNSTRTLTISPSGSEYRYYVKGKRFTRTQPVSVSIEDSSGLWFVYFDTTGAIQSSKTPWNLFTTAPICIIYWNATMAAAQFIGEERHMCTMDPATHEYMHHTEGTRYRGGLVAGNYTLIGAGDSDADVQLSISDGSIQDEDIVINIKHAAVPTAKFEQNLTAPAKLPVMHRSGASWVKDVSTVYPVKLSVDRIAYNTLNAGSWVIQQADEGKYVVMYIVATNALSDPVVAIMGQRQDDSIDEAKQNNDFAKLVWGDMPFSEFKALYRVIYQTSSSYTNAVKARMVQIDDLRNVVTQTISAIPTANHDALTGLSADDHPQYIHSNLPRVITAQHSYAPASPQAPFALGANAQGQLVPGLNADLLDGLSSESFQPASAVLNQASAITGSGLVKRAANGVWSAAALLASEIPNLSWNKITTDKPTTLAGYGITDAVPTNVIKVSTGTVPIQSGTNTNIVVDDNTPSATEGVQLFQHTVTPRDALSRFLFDFSAMADTANKDRALVLTLFRRIGVGAWVFLGYSAVWFTTANGPQVTRLYVEDAPQATQDVTYMVRTGLSGNGSWFIGRTRDRVMGGVNPSSYSITEFKP